MTTLLKLNEKIENYLQFVFSKDCDEEGMLVCESKTTNYDEYIMGEFQLSSVDNEGDPFDFISWYEGTLDEFYECRSQGKIEDLINPLCFQLIQYISCYTDKFDFKTITAESLICCYAKIYVGNLKLEELKRILSISV